MKTKSVLQHYLFSEKIDDNFLHNWISNVVDGGNTSFQDGILGVGWLLGYLIEHNYIEADADEILGDIDDAIYKLCIREIVASQIDVNELLCFVGYYQQRISYNSDEHIYRRFIHMECMKLLLEKLNQYLRKSVKMQKKNLVLSTNILMKYSRLVRSSCVSEGLVEEPFYNTIENLIKFYEQEKDKKVYSTSIAKLYFSVKQYHHPHWEIRLFHILEELRINQLPLETIQWLYLAEAVSLECKEDINNYEKPLRTPENFSVYFEYITNTV
ncbi:hypothetical protein H8S90_24540 [Olivibacter sp. SDN3]|uniref:hypothetical protein n=1 Tax=Olivibacter sp. SDN3 TaxID=2764720 RepID=UPI0016511402|nr:hypothetical protein [Olivibacter sp. SDN3]QNL49830.1 hypothetical protein H8S90_24540 [Olivibacter sp. SDN3]